MGTGGGRRHRLPHVRALIAAARGHEVHQRPRAAAINSSASFWSRSGRICQRTSHGGAVGLRVRSRQCDQLQEYWTNPPKLVCSTNPPGKLDEIFGLSLRSFFSVKMAEGMKPISTLGNETNLHKDGGGNCHQSFVQPISD